MKNYTENDIRVAAYYNWLNNGCQNGNDLQNWNAAIQQLSSKISCSSKSSCSTKSSSKACSSKTSVKKASSKNTNKEAELL